MGPLDADNRAYRGAQIGWFGSTRLRGSREGKVFGSHIQVLGVLVFRSWFLAQQKLDGVVFQIGPGDR